MSKRDWKSLHEFEEIKLEYWNHIAKITINRPRYYNAFTPTTTTEMAAALEMLRENQDVYTIVFNSIFIMFCINLGQAFSLIFTFPFITSNLVE